jgi:uncharacterized protein (DUF4415 family)
MGKKKATKARYVPKEFRLGSRMRILEKEEMHRVRPDAFLPRNIKVRVTMYLDSDILNFFKGLSKDGARYQTQINAALREVVERAGSAEPEDVAGNLRQARWLIDKSLRKIALQEDRKAFHGRK